MLQKDVIQKAISAHAGWKARLRNVASTGTFDTPVATVQADNKCDFGKWLYGAELSGADKQSEHYLKVKQLHAEFHKIAAKVVEWATTNQKDKAAQTMAMGGAYSKASTSLTQAMMQWRDSIS